RGGQSFAGQCTESTGPVYRVAVQQAAARADLRTNAEVLSDLLCSAKLLGARRRFKQLHPGAADHQQFEQLSGKSLSSVQRQRQYFLSLYGASCNGSYSDWQRRFDRRRFAGQELW